MIIGMDVSSYPEMMDKGYTYYDETGKKTDVLDYGKRKGFNYGRLRLWNEPRNIPESGGYCDLIQTIAMAKRMKALNIPYLLDFHYSDWWADPEHQNIPKAWEKLTIDEMAEKLCAFTKQTLLALQEADVYPDMIQIGNEIRNGMLFPVAKVPNWENLAKFVISGISAAREVCPETKIIIHLDEGATYAYYEEWFDRMIEQGMTDFDVIGLSYYPYIHGSFSDFEDCLTRLAKKYGRELNVAEFAHPFRRSKGNFFGEKEELCAGYPASPVGQQESLQHLIRVIRKVPQCSGFFYWEPFMHCENNDENGWGTFMGLMDDKGYPTIALQQLRKML